MERSSMSDVMRQRRNAEASSCVCEAVAHERVGPLQLLTCKVGGGASAAEE